ncbi:MAG TPA: serine hydrolase [Pyrinomonadaceae bacterium]|jgi:CubicO group peptidase (beta-lactamase class C family)
MKNKYFASSVAALWLAFALFAVSLPVSTLAQTAARPAQIGSAIVAPEYASALAKIEEKLETRRNELGIPGLSIVIVKDDQIIYLKGLGYKDFENKIAVTPDTQFAIGSATKAFTGLSVMMSQDEGKLNLDDSPKKYLSYFKINDPEIDSKITIRDLLSHGSGLNRTDLAWITGKLSREDIIRVAGEAKPNAKFREKFQYQNVMFTAAGEIVAQTQKMPWEKFVETRILKPLGMTNSNISIPEMEKSKDYSFGYEFNSDTKETIKKPFRNFPTMTPAGAINSSARDMANWLKFMLNGGAVNGKRLVSEAAFAELTKPQMKITPNGKVNYGLGWFLQEWNGMKVVQHGGNIDGFNALVAMVPEKKTGFVILTNVSASPLPAGMMSVVWENLIGKPQTEATAQNAATAIKPETEVGKYRFEAAGFDVEVTMKDGKLVALVPGQPNYTLENVSGRKYKLTGAPDGFFITFRDADAYLEQPQGNYTLPRVKADAKLETAPAGAVVKELVGKYENEKNPASTVEVVEKEGKVSLVVGGQSPYELREKAKDIFSSPGLPDEYSVKAKRDAQGKLVGIILVQPQGDAAFNRQGETKAAAASAPQITIDELMPKVIEALGGESNWRKFNSRVVKYELDFVHQGIKGYGTQYAKAPNLTAAESTFTAVGKPIATAYEYFNGTEGGEEASFSTFEKATGKSLEDARINADFYGLTNWKTNYKKTEIKPMAKVGDEEAYVVVFEPEKGNKDTIYFSTKTFLPIKLESVVSSSTRGVDLPYTETYSDYRTVDGIKVPFRIINSNVGNGDTVTILKEVKHNVAIDNKVFGRNK